MSAFGSNAASPVCQLTGKIAACPHACYNVCMTKHDRIAKTKSIKLIPVGNSTGVIFPKELLQELGAGPGDELSVVKTPNGIELSVSNAEFEREMTLAREVMARRWSALRELSK
jgi:putative addiction module antidote